MSSTVPRKDGGVEVTPSLADIFGGGSDSETVFQNDYDVQKLSFCGMELKVRQFGWHEANANQVWPGTFTLAEYLSQAEMIARYSTRLTLELGAATGALALYLKMKGFQHIVTSDIADGEVVEQNIAYNFRLNNQEPCLHVEHTWGEAWPEEKLSAASVEIIIASDILLYVKQYANLVKSLECFFAAGTKEFIMSWNRRISTTPIFFAMMKDAGFEVQQLPKCLYIFTKP